MSDKWCHQILFIVLKCYDKILKVYESTKKFYQQISGNPFEVEQWKLYWTKKKLISSNFQLGCVSWMS